MKACARCVALLLGVVAGLQCGCASAQPKAQGKFVPLTTESLANARARWQAAGIKSYDYSPSCEYFTAPHRIKPLWVVVRRGKVVRVSQVWSPSVDFITSDPMPIEGMFDELQRRMEENVARGEPDIYEVLFDPASGYPARIAMRQNERRRETLSDYGFGCAIDQFRFR
jgi:hypothetical protein